MLADLNAWLESHHTIIELSSNPLILGVAGLFGRAVASRITQKVRAIVAEQLAEKSATFTTALSQHERKDDEKHEQNLERFATF